MGRWRRLAAGLLLLLSSAAAATGHSAPPTAAEWPVPATEGALAEALAKAPEGALLRLAPGVHRGPVTLTRAVSLLGEPGARLEGDGNGSVVTVAAPGVRISGLAISGSGIRLDHHDAAVRALPPASGVRIDHNVLEGNLFGVFLEGPRDARVVHNRIHGRRDLRLNERGNGIHAWNVHGAEITYNTVDGGRDGIFITTSHGNTLSHNTFTELRFAIHYMYSNRNTVADNHSSGNAIGFALMFSHHLTVTGNTSRGDREHGLMLNFTNGSTITGNRVAGEQRTGKCLFLYNASKNQLARNHFEGCGIGIHFTAGSERNTFQENAFIANRTQVKYVGTHHHDWSHGGRGNYWSDHPGFDLNGDGLADTAYRPNDLVDQVVWRHPLAKLLLTSPVVTTLRAAQRRFPALLPGGVVDSHPLMRPPTMEEPAA